MRNPLSCCWNPISKNLFLFKWSVISAAAISMMTGLQKIVWRLRLRLSESFSGKTVLIPRCRLTCRTDCQLLAPGWGLSAITAFFTRVVSPAQARLFLPLLLSLTMNLPRMNRILPLAVPIGAVMPAWRRVPPAPSKEVERFIHAVVSPF